MEQWEPVVTNQTPPAVAPEAEPPLEIPEGIRQARAHLRRDLPALLASWWTRGKWALYSKDGRVKISRHYIKLVREANDRGLADDECVIEKINSRAGSEEEEEIDIFDV
jgi:hypothetical protein